MKERKIDLLFGFLIGLFTTLLCASLYFYFGPHKIPLDMFRENKILWPPMLKIGIIGNVVWIFLFNKYNKPNLLRGIGAATIFGVIFIMYLQFTA